MSCCDGTAPNPEISPQEKIDKILKSLPQIVLAPTDNVHPLASSIRNSMPMTVGSVYGTPKVHDDGVIEFTPVDAPPPPNTINGYQQDVTNPWRFVPVWPECQLRMAGVRRDKAGAIDVKMICNNPQVTTFQKYVMAEQCVACPAKMGARKNPAQPEG